MSVLPEIEVCIPTYTHNNAVVSAAGCRHKFRTTKNRFSVMAGHFMWYDYELMSNTAKVTGDVGRSMYTAWLCKLCASAIEVCDCAAPRQPVRHCSCSARVTARTGVPECPKLSAVAWRERRQHPVLHQHS